jgi:ferritin
MLDYKTLQSVRSFIKKQIEETKQDIVYGIDTIDRLQYAKGKLSALEVLLQDLKDLQNTEESIDDDNSA